MSKKPKTKKAATSKKKTTSSKKAAPKSTTKKKTEKPKKTAKKSTKTKKTSTKKSLKKKETPKKTEKKKPTRKKPSKKDIEMLGELEAEIHSDDEQVCLGAVERLGVLTHPDATRVLIVALADQRYLVRIHAAAQLGERKDKKSVDALIESLNDDSVFVRQTVAGALENIGGTKAKKALSKAEKEGLLLDELPEGKRLED
ncbi:MAG: HEAT repeat domain-containing protein [Candidatus Thorarchaeota archaeon]